MLQKIGREPRIKIVNVYSDIPDAQMSKEYYLEKIKLLVIGCKLPGGEHKLLL